MRTALVLAGGEGRRLGGVDKAMVDVAGSTMLDRVLAAAAPNCDDLVVVGPVRATELDGVRFTIEDERGGGPVPAVAAGLASASDADVVLVLAVDLPLLSASDVAGLVDPLDADDVDAVAALDHRGLPNPLLAAYRAADLRLTVDGLGAGAAASQLLPARTITVDLGPKAFNVNAPGDLEQARRLLQRET
jgi:molybdopterin-guanine dinucleotide biosynthesis protein A